MTLGQEGELVEGFSHEAQKGLTITARYAQKRIKQKIGIDVSDDFVCDYIVSIVDDRNDI